MYRVTIGGDVVGRGVDQVLDFPGDSTLYEDSVKDSRDYVDLIIQKLSRVYRVVKPEWISGNTMFKHMLPSWKRLRSDVWILNLETSLTRSTKPFPHKGINYKMNPQNLYFLEQLRHELHCPLVLSLANNHSIDWNYEGLFETINTLQKAKFPFVGAGRDAEEAQKPVILEKTAVAKLFIFGCCHSSSGVPSSWEATQSKPGVFLVQDLSHSTVDLFRKICHFWRCKRSDPKVLMIHYGANWVRKLDTAFQSFGRSLIDELGFSIIANTSPHHILGIEKYKGGLICYGVSDFVQDYYGIDNPSEEKFHPNLGRIISARISRQQVINKDVKDVNKERLKELLKEQRQEARQEARQETGHREREDVWKISNVNLLPFRRVGFQLEPLTSKHPQPLPSA